MNYSFDTLTEIAQKQLGASLDMGDLIICDNFRGDKRKVLQKTKNGFMIYYGRLDGKHKYAKLRDHDGPIPSIKESIM